MDAWLIVLVIGLPWIGGLAVLLAGDDRAALQHGLSIGFALAAALATFLLLPWSTSEAVIRIPMGSVFGDLTFVPDGLGLFLASVATGIGSLTVIFSAGYMSGEAQLGRYYALMLYFIGAMAALALSGSLLFLFFFWEITAFCSYALISFHNDDPKAVAGGIKALIVTQLGGVGLLLLALTAYAWVGDYQIDSFLAAASDLPGPVLGAMAFGCLIAAAAKSAQVPFQTWLPDAMEAPTPISALIHAATMVNAGVYLLARLYPAFAPVPGWSAAVMAVGLLSILLAGLMASVTLDLKRVLAYSTISQLGYMVYAVGIGAITASQFHLLSHAFFKSLLFLSAGAVIHVVGTRDMRRMGGLGKQMPFVRAVFVIGALALMGLPPLNGFWSKELILEAGSVSGPFWVYLLLLAGAGITAYYSARCLWMVWFAPPAETRQAHALSRAMSIPLGLLAAGTLTTWLLAGPFSQFLAATSPFQTLHVVTTAEMVVEIVTLPATYVAILVVLAGIGAWRWRTALTPIFGRFGWLSSAAANDFGFEWVNSEIVKLTRSSADTRAPHPDRPVELEPCRHRRRTCAGADHSDRNPLR